MTDTHPTPESLLPLSSAVFHIMLALVDEERHGYGIIKEVEERTEGEVRLATGTLYGALKRLLDRGLVEELEERTDPNDDERRRYYQLTDFGQQVLTAEAERLATLVRHASRKRLIPGLQQGGS